MDNHDVLDLMTHAADTAIMPRWRSLGKGDITEKSPGDLVTVADTEAEKIITSHLRSSFPEAIVLGEEANESYPDLLPWFSSAEHAFTVDPIDGTANFVNGSQDFAVMVSELKKGEVIRAWIYQPAHGVSFTAEKGAGAYRNSKRLNTRPADADESSWHGITSRKSLRKDKFPPLSRLHSGWWCCGVDYPNVAMGRADYVVYKHVKPWDHAPGSLILSEIGGQSVRRDGKLYSPTTLGERWIISGNADIPRRVLPYLVNSMKVKKSAAEPEGNEPEDLLSL